MALRLTAGDTLLVNGKPMQVSQLKEETIRFVLMKDQIMTLLEDWKERQPPELAKPDKKMDMEK